MKDCKEATRSMVMAAVRALASVCDGASDRDGQGFNREDTVEGRFLANQLDERWTERDVRSAYWMLQKYQKQLLAEHGIDWNEIPRPPSEPGELVNILEEDNDDIRGESELGLRGSESVLRPVGADIRPRTGAAAEAEPDALSRLRSDDDGDGAGDLLLPSVRSGEVAPEEVEVAGEEVEVPVEYVCGIAGSGKTFLMKQRIEDDPRYGVLAATTGISAMNLNTITINSLLKYFDTQSLEDAYCEGWLTRRLKLLAKDYRNIVVDETSMLDARQLDILYKALQEVNDETTHLGLVLVGDFAQLPPVKCEYCFHAECWPKFDAHTTRLTKVWRQGAGPFLDALNLIRAGKGAEGAELLKSCVKFERMTHQDFDGTTILGKNLEVDRYNWLAYGKLKGREYAIKSYRWGKQQGEWKHVPETLKLKVGALVMCLSNDTSKDMLTRKSRFQWVNGDLGHVAGADGPTFYIKLLRNGKEVAIQPIVRNYEQREDPDENEIARWTTERNAPYYDGERKRWVMGAVTYTPLRLAYASTVHKCVDPRTWVVSRSRGYRHLEEVQVGEEILTGQGFAKILAKSDSLRYKHVLQTKRGYVLEGSREHPVLTRRGFVPLESLVAGDIVLLAGNRDYGRHTMDDRSLPWLLGVLVGDGSYTNRREGTIEVCCQESEIWVEVARILLRYKITLNIRKDRRGAYFSNQKFRRKLLNEFDLDYVVAPHKRVPERIFAGGASERAGFLRGLFDTDGHVGTKRIVFSTSSRQLAIDVQNLLLSLEIPSHRREDHPLIGLGAGKTYWQVSMSRAAFPLFRDRVGFFLTRKRDRLFQAPPPKFNCKQELAKMEDEVSVVEEVSSLSPCRMIDLEVEGNHTFVANGFITHNCQSLSLDRIQVDVRGGFMSAPNMIYTALSRGREPEGITIVGTPEILAARVAVHPEVKRWL